MESKTFEVKVVQCTVTNNVKCEQCFLGTFNDKYEAGRAAAKFQKHNKGYRKTVKEVTLYIDAANLELSRHKLHYVYEISNGIIYALVHYNNTGFILEEEFVIDWDSMRAYMLDDSCYDGYDSYTYIDLSKLFLGGNN